MSCVDSVGAIGISARASLTSKVAETLYVLGFDKLIAITTITTVNAELQGSASAV